MEPACLSSISLTTTLNNEGTSKSDNAMSDSKLINDSLDIPPSSSSPTVNEVDGQPQPGEDDDKSTSDYESFSEVELWDGVWREKHNGHWDMIDYDDPWHDEDGPTWWVGWVSMSPHNETNRSLYETEKVREWMQTVANPDQACRTMFMHWPAVNTRATKIPLFKGDNGWEYQVSLCGGVGELPLPGIHCPRVVPKGSYSSTRMFRLVPRALPHGANGEEAQGRKLPELCLTLGRLTVRNNARVKGREEWVTESTDYDVVLDVGHPDIPVWLFAARLILEGRLSTPYYPEPIRPLSVFNGLLGRTKETEEKLTDDETGESTRTNDGEETTRSEDTNEHGADKEEATDSGKEKEDLDIRDVKIEDLALTEVKSENSTETAAIDDDMETEAGQIEGKVGEEDANKDRGTQVEKDGSSEEKEEKEDGGDVEIDNLAESEVKDEDGTETLATDEETDAGKIEKAGGEDANDNNKRSGSAIPRDKGWIPGYDCGCILPSVRLLANPLTDEDSLAAYRNACELLRETRAVIDPAGLYIPKELEDHFIAEGANFGSKVARLLEVGGYVMQDT